MMGALHMLLSRTVDLCGVHAEAMSAVGVDFRVAG